MPTLSHPPCVHSVWKRGRGTAAEEVNNGGNHEVELVSKGLVNKSLPPILNRS